MKVRAHILNAIGILAIVCSFLVFDLNAQTQPQVKRDAGKSKKLLVEGDKLFRQRNYQTAMEKFVESVKFDFTNNQAHFFKGYTHYFLKQYDDALSELNIAAQQKYKLIEIQKVRAFVNYERKDYDAALADLKVLIAAEPRNLDYLKLAGEISLGQKNYDEALAAYKGVAAALPNDANVVFALAQIYAAKGDLENQAAYAEKAMQMGTMYRAEAQLLAADAYLKLGKTQQYEAALLRVIEGKPDSREVYRTLGEMYRSQSRFNDAIEITRRALRIWTTDGGFYTDNSWYYSLAGRHEDAIQAAQAGIRYQPDQPMAYTNLCRAYNDVEKFELAISACNGALKLKPEDGETLFYLARANDGLNKTAEATRLYKRAVAGLIIFTRDNPTYSDAFYLLGNAYYADNQSANAITAYKRALDLSPRFARARYNLGMVFLDGKDKSGASEQHRLLAGIDRELAGKLKTEIDKMP